MTTTELFANAFSKKLVGDLECYWCAAPCGRQYPHNQPRLQIGQKRDPSVKRMSNAYECEGCRLFDFTCTTVQFLTEGKYKDRQHPVDYSWWITDKGAWCIHEDDYPLLYALLLNPPIPFALGLLDKKMDPKAKNKIRCIPINDPLTIKADTQLAFTINNVLHHYTVYELELALKQDPNGKDPGVRLLVELLGEYKFPEEKKPDEEVKRGRPSEPSVSVQNTLKKTIRKS